MEIAILGTGCPKCRQTAEVVRQAVEQAGVDATIHKVEDIKEIMKFKVMTTPAVAFDGLGRFPERFRRWTRSKRSWRTVGKHERVL